MSFWVLGYGLYSFGGGLTGGDEVDLGSLFSRAGMKRPVCLKVIFMGNLVSNWSFKSQIFVAFLSKKVILG